MKPIPCCRIAHALQREMRLYVMATFWLWRVNLRLLVRAIIETDTL